MSGIPNPTSFVIEPLKMIKKRLPPAAVSFFIILISIFFKHESLLDRITDKKQYSIHNCFEDNFCTVWPDPVKYCHQQRAAGHLNSGEQEILDRSFAGIFFTLKYDSVIDQIIVYGRDHSRAYRRISDIHRRMLLFK